MELTILFGILAVAGLCGIAWLKWDDHKEKMKKEKENEFWHTTSTL